MRTFLPQSSSEVSGERGLEKAKVMAAAKIGVLRKESRRRRETEEGGFENLIRSQLFFVGNEVRDRRGRRGGGG